MSVPATYTQDDKAIMAIELGLSRLGRITSEWERWHGLKNALSAADEFSFYGDRISPPGTSEFTTNSASCISVAVQVARRWMKLIELVVHSPHVTAGKRVFLPWPGSGGVAPLRLRMGVLMTLTEKANTRIIKTMEACGMSGEASFRLMQQMVVVALVRHLLPCPIRSRLSGWHIPFANHHTASLLLNVVFLRLGVVFGSTSDVMGCVRLMRYAPCVALPDTEDEKGAIGKYNYVSLPGGDFRVLTSTVKVSLIRAFAGGDPAAWRAPASNADMTNPEIAARGSMCVAVFSAGDRVGHAAARVSCLLSRVSTSTAFHNLVAGELLAAGPEVPRLVAVSSMVFAEMLLENASMAAGMLVHPSTGDLGMVSTSCIRRDISCLVAVLEAGTPSNMWLAVRVQPETMEIFGVTMPTYVFVHGPTIMALFGEKPSRAGDGDGSSDSGIIARGIMPVYIGCIVP